MPAGVASGRRRPQSPHGQTGIAPGGIRRRGARPCLLLRRHNDAAFQVGRVSPALRLVLHEALWCGGRRACLTACKVMQPYLRDSIAPDPTT
jgi:hypothetical protein